MSNKFDKISSNVPPIYQPGVNTGWKGILETIAVGDEGIETAFIDGKKQIFLKTASGDSIDRIGSNVGIGRFIEIGLNDADYKLLIPNQSYSARQIRENIWKLLEIFYKEDSIFSHTSSSKAEPFNLSSANVINILVDKTKKIQLTFTGVDFSDITQATAFEVAEAINKKASDLGLTARQITSLASTGNHVQILTNTPGPNGQIQVVGGSAQKIFQFPSNRDTKQSAETILTGTVTSANPAVTVGSTTATYSTSGAKWAVTPEAGTLLYVTGPAGLNALNKGIFVIESATDTSVTVTKTTHVTDAVSVSFAATDLKTNTHWSLTKFTGNRVRLEWKAGKDPRLQEVRPGDIVILFSPFSDDNRGSFEVLKVVIGATIDNTSGKKYTGNYIEFENKLAVGGDVDSGTAQGNGGGANTIQLRPTASTINDYYNGMTISITGGTTIQSGTINNYVGSNRIATLTAPWNTNDITGASVYSIVEDIGQTSAQDVLFYFPEIFNANKLERPALLYEVNNRELIVTIPSTTQVVNRSLLGSSHLHLNTDDTLAYITNTAGLPFQDGESLTTIDCLYASGGGVGNFVRGDTVAGVGGGSGVVFQVLSNEIDNTILFLKSITGTFLPGAKITGSVSLATRNLISPLPMISPTISNPGSATITNVIDPGTRIGWKPTGNFTTGIGLSGRTALSLKYINGSFQKGETLSAVPGGGKTMYLTTPWIGDFAVGDTVTGGTSGKTAPVTGIVISKSDNSTILEIGAPTGTFTNGETISGSGQPVPIAGTIAQFRFDNVNNLKEEVSGDISGLTPSGSTPGDLTYGNSIIPAYRQALFGTLTPNTTGIDNAYLEMSMAASGTDFDLAPISAVGTIKTLRVQGEFTIPTSIDLSVTGNNSWYPVFATRKDGVTPRLNFQAVTAQDNSLYFESFILGPTGLSSSILALPGHATDGKYLFDVQFKFDSSGGGQSQTSITITTLDGVYSDVGIWAANTDFFSEGPTPLTIGGGPILIDWTAALGLTWPGEIGYLTFGDHNEDRNLTFTGSAGSAILVEVVPSSGASFTINDIYSQSPNRMIAKAALTTLSNIPTYKEIMIGQTSGAMGIFQIYDSAGGTLVKSATGDPFKSSYLFDPNAQTLISSLKTTLKNAIPEGTTISLAFVNVLPSDWTTSGYLMFDFGTSTEEGPVKFIGKPNSTSLMIDPGYVFQYGHSIGGEIHLVSTTSSYTPKPDGSSYLSYATDIQEARAILEALIEDFVAAGIVLRFIVNYPDYPFSTYNTYNI